MWLLVATMLLPWAWGHVSKSRRPPWQSLSCLQCAWGSQRRPSAFHVKETTYRGLYNRHSLWKSQTCFSHDQSHFMVHLSDAMGLPPQYRLHTWTVILLMPGFTAHVFIPKPFSLDPSPVACLSLSLSLLTVPRGSNCRPAPQPSPSCLSFTGQACSWACCLPDWHAQHRGATAFLPVQWWGGPICSHVSCRWWANGPPSPSKGLAYWVLLGSSSVKLHGQYICSFLFH